MELLEKNLRALMIPRSLKTRRKHICIYDKEFPRVIILKRCLFLSLVKQPYCHKFRKAFFSKCYYRHSELIVKYNICLKPLCNKAYQNLYFMVI